MNRNLARALVIGGALLPTLVACGSSDEGPSQPNGPVLRVLTVRIAALPDGGTASSQVHRIRISSRAASDGVVLDESVKDVSAGVGPWSFEVSLDLASRSNDSIDVAVRLLNVTGNVENVVHEGTSTRIEAKSATLSVSFVFRSPRRSPTVEVGRQHTCALDDAGSAYCWGRNEVGSLGDGSLTDRSSPVRVTGGLAFTTISSASYNNCGVTTSGSAYCWGIYLGSDSRYYTSPARVPHNEAFVQVSAGDDSCGITDGGALYCWRGPSNLELAQSFGRPTKMGDRYAMVTEVGGGAYFARCGVTTDGVAHCWGRNWYGEFGNGSTDTLSTTMPRVVPTSLRFSTLSMGTGHVCGLNLSGQAFCWGNNEYGQLGDGTSGNSRPTPVAVTGGHRFTSLSVGDLYTCGVTDRAEAYCWGINGQGQLGDATTLNRPGPVRAAGALTFETVQSSDGRLFRNLDGSLARVGHTCGVATDGGIYCWGDNGRGQLGDGTTAGRLAPVRVPLENR